MYTASSMLSKARNNYILPDIKNNNYYYNVYLRSDHWKTLREEKLAKSCYCEKCGTKSSLDVHHIDYKGLYDVKLKDLQTLCRKCHDKIHTKKKTKKLSRYSKKLQKRNHQKFEKLNREIEDLKQFLTKKYNVNTLKHLPKRILHKIIQNEIKLYNSSPTWLSPCNKIRQQKFNKIMNWQQKDLNNYVSIHY